jgi:hypothetical protein
MSTRRAHRAGRTRLALFLAASVVLTLAIVHAPAGAAATGDISGVAFQDLDRDGVQDPGEAPYAGHQLYLFESPSSAYVGTTLTDAAGRYEFLGLRNGDYVVELEGSSWSTLRRDWAPTTTGSVLPRHLVHLSGAARADFGWRPIVRSTTIGAPVSAFAGPSGLRVESYDDVVTAREVHDVLVQGLVGVEATAVTVRFDIGGDTTSTAVSLDEAGRYERYGATVSVSYLGWLDGGPMKAVHEYGHAWSLYHAYVTQQDPTLAAYLAARGLVGDPRLGTSHAWAPRELIAEDYRQLLGAPSARAASQENTAIAPAAQVPGLLEFLRGTFTSAAPSTTGEEPAPSTLAVADLAVSPTPVRSAATVAWSATAPASVTVAVTNAKGATVRTLLRDAARPDGASSIGWDRTNDAGRRVGKGTYTVTVRAVSASGTVTVSRSFSVG